MTGPPARTHRLAQAFGLAFAGLLFGVLPLLAVHLNGLFGLPRWQSGWARAGGVLLCAIGVALLATCSRLLARIGRGTPAPLAPARELVAVGPYRYSRNPIYAADVVFVLGLFLVFGHLSLLVYAALVAAGLHAVVVWVEEPSLRARFGPEYARYAKAVPRWIPLRRPHRGIGSGVEREIECG